MIDNFALGLIHLLLAIAVWRLLARPDLDSDPDESLPPRAKAHRSPRTKR
ncbi:hypothetical protein [Novosphingobium sp. Gsoil 351]|nr:hypothetical protein [Novosphingobium sp. Gsoil 351]